MPPGHQSTDSRRRRERSRRGTVWGGRPKDAGLPPSGPVHPEPVTAQRCASHGYAMSPLPRWEERPRRRSTSANTFSFKTKSLIDNRKEGYHLRREIGEVAKVGLMVEKLKPL
ncbi:hypothetical protein HPP92_019478 [Vanilla planifolia]|uniref:Uncharacterized protein n=1 Tax=Vanilla planifolia TaxID=51239 RepID=A0A835Q924_VANPL|nr:hypothetical protein HPP92_019478 [Vanilla planifolia]